MPLLARRVALALAVASYALPVPALAQADSTGKPPAPASHRATKPKPHAASPFAEAGAMHEDDWFSLGPPTEAEIEKEAPGVRIAVHDPQEEDIVVYGARLKRDFEGAAPVPNLTSPQALQAAQPAFVPNMGDSCTYKYGCFDMSQTPLRSAAEGLFGGD